MAQAILPGATIGILGGGQLGRMLCTAARNMGYQVAVLDPDADSPAGRIAETHIHASYDDRAALDDMATRCDVITTEFENIPADTVRYLAERCPVFPDALALETAQHRVREKTFAADAGLQPAPFHAVNDAADFAAAIEVTGLPALLKSATLGYDGKGQVIVNSETELAEAFAVLGRSECVLEQLIDIDREISVIVSRNARGEGGCYAPAENVHVNGILHTSSVPAEAPSDIVAKAEQQARALAGRLDYVGVLAVEFFISTGGELLFNEMAPRPHNSGHYTEDACVTSQFDQQTRMICGLPPGDTRLVSPVAMVNLLGDLWEPDWSCILDQPIIKLHLYGKKVARPGRKMGHYNVLSESRDEALATALRVFDCLSG